jgi:ankyrin repeat protein
LEKIGKNGKNWKKIEKMEKIFFPWFTSKKSRRPLDANFNIPNSVGRTAMHFLSISNSPHLAKQLSRDVFRINMEITDRDGNTPFMAAVRYDSSRMVQYFLQVGYRREKKDKYGYTPLQ